MTRARLVDVAALAGVSTKTVSNVVNAQPQVRVTTRARVQEAIGELGHRPNAGGRRLRRGRTGLIALAVPEIDVPYFAELARHVVEAAASCGLTVLIEQTSWSSSTEQGALEAPEAGLVDGLIMSPVATAEAELEARRAGVAVVLLGEGVRPDGVDHVGIDDGAAAAEATAHLVAGGRTRTAFLGGAGIGLTRTSEGRHAGWSRALDAAGVQPGARPRLHVERFSAAEGRASVTAALAAGTAFDALICASDVLALGALRALDEAGLSVPHDVAVIGWDDVALAAHTTPPLTSVRPDVQGIAASAVRMLAERIDGEDGPGRRVLARHELVVRASSTADTLHR